MRTPRPFALAAPVVLAGLAVIAPVRAAANGGKAKMIKLEDRVAASDGRSYTFVSEIDPTLFTLLTLKDRYRVVRIQVRNGSGQRLTLSRQADKAELVWDERQLAGIITLDQRDAALWDQLSPEMRKVLVYPAGVEPGEEESLFVFVPAAGIEAPPQEIRLTLTGLPRPVRLRHLVAAAKH
jgi:hypothetical protein